MRAVSCRSASGISAVVGQQSIFAVRQGRNGQRGPPFDLRQGLPGTGFGSSPLWPTNVYGRYHYLRDVARQAFDASRSLDPRSLMRMAQRYGRSIMLALAWATAAPSLRCWDSMTLGTAMPTGSSILSWWAFWDGRQNHLRDVVGDSVNYRGRLLDNCSAKPAA